MASVWRQSGLPYKSAADCEFYGKIQGITCVHVHWQAGLKMETSQSVNQPFASCGKEMCHLWNHTKDMSHGLLIENRYKFNALP